MEAATLQRAGSRVRAETAPRATIVALLVLIIAGFALRWMGVGDASISHPEIYVPGLALSPETVTPPPRHGFFETLLWHFHKEPHPIGWYMGMLGWTSVLGDSELAVRGPGIILGTASILLIYLLGAALYCRVAGFVAAALLAFHGFHIFWSGMARMYAPGAFLGLLATFLFVKLASDVDRDRHLAAGYVASLAAAIYTTELNWAVFAAHAGWAAFYTSEAKRPRLSTLHFIAFIIAAPALLHAVYLARGGAAADPSIGFLVQYVSFGFLFEADEFSEPFRFANPLFIAGGAVLCSTLVAIGVLRKTRINVRLATPSAIPLWVLAAAAIVCMAFMFWLSTIATRRGVILAIMSAFPMAALLWPFMARHVRPALAKVASPIERAFAQADPFTVLIALLAVVAPFAIFVASFGKSVTVYRAFIVFTPYLLVLAGAGLAALLHRKLAFTAASAAAAALLAASIAHAAARPASPIDYKGLAANIMAGMDDGDLILVRRRDWMDAPVTYYLPHEAIIGNRYAERIGGAPRVWVIRWEEHRISLTDVEIAKAISNYSLCKKVTARRATAKLYARNVAACGPAGG